MIIKLNETKAKTKTSGAFYVLANNDDPDIYGEDFYCWDTDYDSGYGLGPIQSAKRSRDVFKTLEAAEERARDIIYSVGVSEVFIVEVEDEYSYNLTDFVKKVVITDNIDESIEDTYCESEFIKETTEAVPDYVQRPYVAVDYICDGITNFRVLGGGFNTDSALVGVVDPKGKRLRLSIGDVCDFFTWYDAKGNIIREPKWDNIEPEDTFE